MGKKFPAVCNKILFIYFLKVYLCHDHDTGSELAVKQVEVGLLNTATQRVRQHLNLFFLLGYVLVQNLGSIVISNNTIYRGLCNDAPSFKDTIHRVQVASHFLQSYQSEQTRWRECTLRLPTARKVTRGGKMKVAFLAGGDFHVAHCRISLAVLSLRKTKVYSE